MNHYMPCKEHLDAFIFVHLASDARESTAAGLPVNLGRKTERTGVHTSHIAETSSSVTTDSVQGKNHRILNWLHAHFTVQNYTVQR